MTWTLSDIKQQPDGSFKAKTNPKLAGSTQVIRHEMLIGIDTGTNTGFATYSPISRRLLSVETLLIHEAMERVLSASQSLKVKVRFEDARLRTWYGDKADDKQQGAGSIKRDAVIWEDFLKAKGIAYEAVAPKDNKTKTSPEYFKRLTGWQGRTSEHSRDAAMLVYNF